MECCKSQTTVLMIWCYFCWLLFMLWLLTPVPLLHRNLQLGWCCFIVLYMLTTYHSRLNTKVAPSKTRNLLLGCLGWYLHYLRLKIVLTCCSGRGCGLYVMNFMDILSLKTCGLPFECNYMQNIREKSLLSIL